MPVHNASKLNFQGSRFVIGSVLFKHGGVKSLEYFIQLLGKNHLQVFLKAIFVTPLLKNPHSVNCLSFAYLNFLPLFFNFVTSSMVTVLNLDAILALIEIQEMLPWQFCNFTCEIINYAEILRQNYGVICHPRYLVNKPLSATGISEDNAQG